MAKTNRRKRHRILALFAAGAVGLVVVLIVAIAVFGTMMKERYKQRARSGDPQSAAENDRLRAEITLQRGLI